MSLWHPQKIKYAKFTELAQLRALFFKRAETLGVDGGDGTYTVLHDQLDPDEPCFSSLMTDAVTDADVYTYGVHKIARFLRMPPNGVGRKLFFECRARLLQTALCKFKIGLDYYDSPLFSTYSHAAINYESDVSPNWRCSTYRTAQELTTTTVAVDTAWHVFCIEVTDTYVNFYIDRILVATHTTQIPVRGLGMGTRMATVVLRTLEPDIKEARYEYVSVWNEGV